MNLARALSSSFITAVDSSTVVEIPETQVSDNLGLGPMLHMLSRLWESSHPGSQDIS